MSPWRDGVRGFFGFLVGAGEPRPARFGRRSKHPFESSGAGGAVIGAVGFQLDPLVATVASSSVDVAAWSDPFGLFHGIFSRLVYLGPKVLLIKGMGCKKYPPKYPLVYTIGG